MKVPRENEGFDKSQLDTFLTNNFCYAFQPKYFCAELQVSQVLKAQLSCKCSWTLLCQWGQRRGRW